MDEVHEFLESRIALLFVKDAVQGTPFDTRFFDDFAGWDFLKGLNLF